MANVQYTENLTEEQLDAMAGSETLRYQATSFGVTRNNKVYFVYDIVLSLSMCDQYTCLGKNNNCCSDPFLLLFNQRGEE